MELLAHIVNGWTKDVAIKTLNPLVERKYVLMFQMERAWNFTPRHTKSIKGPNRSTNNHIWTFQQVSLLEGLDLVKKQDLDKKWPTFSYEPNIPFDVVWHLAFIKAMKSTSEFQTYYKPLSYHGLCTNLLKQFKVNVSK
jgi:hypothetical protein